MLHVVGAAIRRGDRCLVARRGPGMSLPGAWEFPGGKVEDDESPYQALAREIREELGLDIAVGRRLGIGTATISTRNIELSVYAASPRGGELALLEHSEVRWLEAGELSRLAWAEADVPVVPAVVRWLRENPG